MLYVGHRNLSILNIFCFFPTLEVLLLQRLTSGLPAGAKGFQDLAISSYHIMIVKPGSGTSKTDATVKVTSPAIVRRGWAL